MYNVDVCITNKVINKKKQKHAVTHMYAELKMGVNSSDSGNWSKRDARYLYV